MGSVVATFLAAWAAGCVSGGAPVTEGTYLIYEISDTRVRLTFQPGDGAAFRTHAGVEGGDGIWEPAAGMPGHEEDVDRRLRTKGGSPLELASLGPVWAPPSELREGGRVYGSPVREVGTESGRPTATVSASVGVGAALRGTWVYDASTGFLLHGSKGTAVSDAALTFRLVDTNVPGLTPP